MFRSIAAGALLALPTVVAFARGGYFDAARLRAGVAACLLAALAAAFGRPLPRSRPGRVALAGLAALTAWAALSVTWAPLAGPALDDVERDVLYLAAFVAAIGLLRDVRWTEPALLAGIAVTAAYGLSERLLPGVFELTRSVAAGDRLSQPLTYWNAQGALAALGLVLAAGAIARRPVTRDGRATGAAQPGAAQPGAAQPGPTRDTARGRAWRWARVGSACVLPLLGLDLYLTLSRGALGALAVGLLVLVALLPTRAALLAAGLTLAGAAVPALLAETALHGVMRADAQPAAGAAMLVVLLGTGAACGYAATRIGDARPLPVLRPLALAALVAALAGTALGLRSGTPTTGSQRLVSVESNRYDYWRVAADTFADHPLRGLGTGGFRVEWLLHRDRDESVRDAHSLYLETAAELGLVGLLALLAFAGGVGAAARRTPTIAAALAAYAVHAGVDWDWELPGLTLVAVLLAGRALAAADAAAAAPPSASSPPRSRP